MTDAPLSSFQVDLRQWRQFVAVAQELHFGRAALRLHMTQPPLTQGIAQLERTLGVKLFNRTKRSVQLTVQGAALLADAQDLLARANDLVALARAQADGSAGRLRLAFVSTVGFSLLPSWLMAFRAACPAVQLELVEATGDVQSELLTRDEVDAGFVLHAPGFAPQESGCRIVAQEPLVVAMPGSHPLASKRLLRVADLLTQPLVMFPRRIAPSLWDAIFGTYHAAGQLPVVTQEAIQMQTIVNLVSAGLGVAWVPASVQEFQRSGVVYRAVQGHSLACETSLVWRRSSPALERFLSCRPQAFS